LLTDNPQEDTTIFAEIDENKSESEIEVKETAAAIGEPEVTAAEPEIIAEEPSSDEVTAEDVETVS